MRRTLSMLQYKENKKKLFADFCQILLCFTCMDNLITVLIRKMLQPRKRRVMGNFCVSQISTL